MAKDPPGPFSWPQEKNCRNPAWPQMGVLSDQQLDLWQRGENHVATEAVLEKRLDFKASKRIVKLGIRVSVKAICEQLTYIELKNPSSQWTHKKICKSHVASLLEIIFKRVVLEGTSCFSSKSKKTCHMSSVQNPVLPLSTG